MLRFLIAIALGCAAAQRTTIAPDILLDVFGDPGLTATVPAPTAAPTPATPNRQGLEDITVKPTTSPLISTDKDGDSCQCVPYYLCDSNYIMKGVDDPTVTGFNELDVRFGEAQNSKCQESVEVCCKAPREKPIELPKPVLKACGFRNPKGLGASIIGNGGEAQFGEFPWVVALIDNTNGSYFGVGVIIHPQVIMTGAHVVYKYGSGGLRIRAGEWDTQTLKEIYEFQERTVQDIVYHENFANKSLWNDVALLRLEEPLQLAEHINTLCLPAPGDRFDNYKNCAANGWGKNSFGLQGRYAVILKKVEQDMIPNDRCLELLRRTRLGRRYKLHSSFVCAGGEQGEDTCEGDGGAGLACPIGDDRYKLAGLVSWGIGCGQKDHPAVFTNVAAFRAWTDAQMKAWGFGTSTYTI